jgi:hypothetical protein
MDGPRAEQESQSSAPLNNGLDPLHLVTSERRQLLNAVKFEAGDEVFWDKMIARRLCKRGLLAPAEGERICFQLTDAGRAALAVEP